MRKLFVSFLISFFAATTFAATAVIDFSGKTSNGTTCSLDKVVVENLTQGWSETTYNVSISYEIMDNNQAVDNVEADKDLIVKNSLDGNVNVQFNMSRSGHVSVFVYDIAGRSVCQSNTMQESGFHSLNLELGTPQMYYLYIATPTNTYSCPILNTSAGNGTQIQYVVNISMAKVPARYTENHTCNVSDVMQYTGYATIGGSQYINVQNATIREGRTSIEFTFDVETADYYIKHPWGTGADADWSWEPMEKNGNNYTYTGLWGGIGANINTDATDAGAQWFSIGSISGAAGLTIGDEVTFIYDPSAGTLSINGGGTNPQQTGYYIKHPWGDGSDASWTWQPMTKSGSKYTYSGLWGGVGANINVVADDGGAQWYPEASISGSNNLYIGEMATFTFVPSNGNVGTLSVSGSSSTIPSTPTNLKATATSSCIQLTWNTVSGATGYNIYMANSASGTYYKIDNTTTNSYTDCNVSASYTYYFKVSAYNNAGESSQSSYVYAKISSGGGGTTQLAAPTGVTASASTSTITVSWNSVSGANKYFIYRSTTQSGTYSQIATEYGTSHIDMNVTSGTTYYYKVAAVSSDGTVGKQSSAASATISGGSGTTTLAAPTNVAAAYMQGVHQVQVTWNEVALCDSYEIYRSTSASSNGTKIGTATSSGGAVYVDKLSSSVDKTWYYYRVKAKSSYLNKTSDYSEQASVYIDKNPVAPCPASNLTISGTSSLSISWSVQTQSGCGTPTEKWIMFYDYSSSSSNKWVSEKVTSNSYTLSSSKLQQYTNGGSTLAGCVELINANGMACLHFEYNTSTKKVTITGTNCY